MTNDELRQLSDKVEKANSLINKIGGLKKNIARIKGDWDMQGFQTLFFFINKESFIQYLESELASLNIEFDKL